jgi:hypothetical protein
MIKKLRKQHSEKYFQGPQNSSDWNFNAPFIQFFNVRIEFQVTKCDINFCAPAAPSGSNPETSKLNDITYLH